MNAIGKSKQVRYLSGQIVAPLGYVRHKIPLQVSNDINKYTVEGRKAIHKQINHIDEYDAFVSTTVVPDDVKDKVISGLPILTGMGADKAYEEILDKLGLN